VGRRLFGRRHVGQELFHVGRARARFAGGRLDRDEHLAHVESVFAVLALLWEHVDLVLELRLATLLPVGFFGGFA
jgi:hypothetical protein